MREGLKKVLSVSYLIKAPIYIYVLVFLFPSLLLGAITTFLPETVKDGYIIIEGVVFEILFAVFVVPFVETAVFQYLIIEIFCKIIKRPRNNIWIAVIISSLAFALSHTYSLSYFIFAFFLGIVLALAYYLGRYRKEGGFFLAFIIHAICNLLSSIHNLIFFDVV